MVQRGWSIEGGELHGWSTEGKRNELGRYTFTAPPNVIPDGRIHVITQDRVHRFVRREIRDPHVLLLVLEHVPLHGCVPEPRWRPHPESIRHNHEAEDLHVLREQAESGWRCVPGRAVREWG